MYARCRRLSSYFFVSFIYSGGRHNKDLSLPPSSLLTFFPCLKPYTIRAFIRTYIHAYSRVGNKTIHFPAVVVAGQKCKCCTANCFFLLCMFKGDKTEFNVCYRVSIFTYTHNRQELNFELGIDSVTSDRKYYYWAIGTNRMQDKSAPATQPLTLPNVLEGIDLLHSNYWLFWFSFHCLNSAHLLWKHRCNNSYRDD